MQIALTGTTSPEVAGSPHCSGRPAALVVISRRHVGPRGPDGFTRVVAPGRHIRIAPPMQRPHGVQRCMKRSYVLFVHRF